MISLSMVFTGSLGAVDTPDLNLVFGFHYRTPTHPLKEFSVASVTNVYNPLDSSSYWCMVGNGTVEIKSVPGVRETQALKTTVPQTVTWKIPNGNRAGRVVLSNTVTTANVNGVVKVVSKDFFITSGNRDDAISINIIGDGGAVVKTLHRPGDEYIADTDGFFDLSADELVASLSGRADIKPPGTSKNCGAHAVARCSFIALDNVKVVNNESPVHFKPTTHEARSYDKDGRNVTSLCAWHWSANWGDYWTPNNWNTQALGTWEIKKATLSYHYCELKQTWNMGNPTSAISIPEEYYGPDYKAITKLSAIAIYNNDAKEGLMDISVSKGYREKKEAYAIKDTKVIGPIEHESEEKGHKPIAAWPAVEARLFPGQTLIYEGEPIRITVNLEGEIAEWTKGVLGIVKGGPVTGWISDLTGFFVRVDVQNFVDKITGTVIWDPQPFTLAGIPGLIGGQAYYVKIKAFRRFRKNSERFDETSTYPHLQERSGNVLYSEILDLADPYLVPNVRKEEISQN